MTELTQQLQKAIEAALPQIQAEELRKFIENAQKESSELKTLKQSLADTKKELVDLKELKAKFDSAEILLSEAKKLKEATDDKERHMQHAVDMITISNKDLVISSYREFLGLLVKNPRAIELTTEVKNIPVYVPYAGGGGFHETKPEFNTITTEKSETKD